LRPWGNIVYRKNNGIDIVFLEFRAADFRISLDLSVFFKKILGECFGAVVHKSFILRIKTIIKIAADVKIIKNVTGQIIGKKKIHAIFVIFRDAKIKHRLAIKKNSED